VSGVTWTEVLNAKELLDADDKIQIRALNVASSNSSFVYALARDTLVRSTDGGNTWLASNSIVDGKGRSLAVDPHNPYRLYLGSWYSGVYRSTDGGSTWQTINNGLPTTWADFRAIVIDPTNPQRIYTGAGNKIYQSTNGGDSWNQIGGELPTNDSIYRIIIDPTNPGNLYVIVLQVGIYKLLGWAPHLVVPHDVTVLLDPDVDPNQVARDILIRNDGGGMLDWNVSSPTQPWLAVQRVDNRLRLTFDRSGIPLVGGRFLDTDVLIITDEEADNSPQTIVITLYVGPVSNTYLPVMMKTVLQ